MQVALDSPVFVPQQFYSVFYAQDTWRVSDTLTLDVGVRYDYYSVVTEKNGSARPFFVEENEFGTDADNFYDPDRNNFAPRLAASFTPWGPKTVLRGGFGLYYGPGQSEDRIQPIENAIERRQASAGDVPNNGLQYPVPPQSLVNQVSIRGYTHQRPDEYKMQYGFNVQREIPASSR